eukprot:jgi/Chlat1/3708/Chrsp251S03862
MHVKAALLQQVQGVFFRNYTVDKARELGLVGYVMNAPDGTVKGEVQGDTRNLAVMKQWLQTEGSPQSRIDKCLFSHEEDNLKELKYSEFARRKTHAM